MSLGAICLYTCQCENKQGDGARSQFMILLEVLHLNWFLMTNGRIQVIIALNLALD